jgi:hypothetical protein
MELIHPRKGVIQMKCPECGGEMKQGKIQARRLLEFDPTFTALTFIPPEDQGKLRHPHAIELKTCGEGYYCETCHKAFAAFEDR